MHSTASTTAVPVPSVLRLTRYVRVPYRAQVPLTRRAVFARDGGRCVYCGAAATSLDHVVPRSRGGAHTWENVVASCARCNHTKADRAIGRPGLAVRHTAESPVRDGLAGARIPQSRTRVGRPTWTTAKPQPPDPLAPS